MELPAFLVLLVTLLGAPTVIRFAPKSVTRAIGPITDREKAAANSTDSNLESKITDTITTVSAALRVQRTLVCTDIDALPARARDRWSLGYIGGYAEILLRRNGIDVCRHESTLMRAVIFDLFGEVKGAAAFRRYRELKNARDAEFFNGTICGGEEVFLWLGDPNRFPMGWYGYLRDARWPASGRARRVAPRDQPIEG